MITVSWLVRAFLTLVAALATFYMTFWLVSSFVLPDNAPQPIRFLVSLAAAGGVGFFVWRRTSQAWAGLVHAITIGALIVGALGFCIGFFGPLVWAPDANQGPLLGIFVTGPLGFVAGAVGGAVYWFTRGRHRRRKPETAA